MVLGSRSEYDVTGWYIGQYKLVMLGTTWYRVSKGLVCLYILEKVDIWSGVTDASHTHTQTTEYIVLLSFS